MHYKLKVLLVNLISLSRILGGALVLYSLRISDYKLALIIFLAFSVTDLVDGRIARRLGAATRTGMEVDAASDMLLIALTLLGITFALGISTWFFLLPLAFIIGIWSCQFIYPRLRDRLARLLTVMGVFCYLLTFVLLVWMSR